MIGVLATVVLALAPALGFSEEAAEGRPHFDADKQSDVDVRGGRGKGVSEEVRRLEEQKAKVDEKIQDLDEKLRKEAKKGDVNTTPETRVTDIDEVSRRYDLTKPSGAEFHELDTLDAKIKADEAREVKFDEKIEMQIPERGWSEGEIRNLTKEDPAGTSVDRRKGKEEPATVYGRPDGYVVVNDLTRDVVQVSDKLRPFIPDSSIKWK